MTNAKHEYQPWVRGWFAMTIMRGSPAAEFRGVDVRRAIIAIEDAVRNMIDGYSWLSGSRLGGVDVRISMMEDLDGESEPEWEQGPDRRYGVLNIVVYLPISRFDDNTTFGSFVTGMVGVCLRALLWVRSRYALPDLIFASAPDPYSRIEGSSAVDPVEKTPPGTEISEVSAIPGEIGVLIPFYEQEHFTVSQRASRIADEVTAALAPMAADGHVLDVENLQDAAVLIFELREDLKQQLDPTDGGS